MEVDANWASLIVGVATAAVLYAGHALARRGQKEQNEQQRAANNLAAVERQRDYERDRANTEQARADRERERADEAEDECDEERRKHRRDMAEQESRCRRSEAQLTDTVRTLRAVVVDEVAKAAADTALSEVKPHPHEDETE